MLLSWFKFWKKHPGRQAPEAYKKVLKRKILEDHLELSRQCIQVFYRFVFVKVKLGILNRGFQVLATQVVVETNAIQIDILIVDIAQLGKTPALSSGEQLQRHSRQHVTGFHITAVLLTVQSGDISIRQTILIGIFQIIFNI